MIVIDKNQYYFASELASIFQVPYVTILEWESQGLIRGSIFNGSVVYYQNEIDRLKKEFELQKG